MKYRNDRSGTPISQLGFGCMRFARKGMGIDYQKAEKEILYAIEQGVNYFDTAYVYPGSEECLGKILENNHLREKVFIATKLPQYMLRSMRTIEKTFQEELLRLRTDYIDYYLMHMFTDYSEWKKLQKLGIEDWIRKHKEDGSIRRIGFSYHGNTEEFLRILDAYPWNFCQIQYNYFDEHSQAGRTGLQAAAEKGIPVVIMEPLRGGKLVNIPKKAQEAIRESGRDWSPAELGLRWLWDQPEVTCVLSGMNSMEMLQENLRIASETEPGQFTEEDHALVEKVKAIITENEKVGCTGCQYCMPCPRGIDIPGYFHHYNLMYLESKSGARFEFARNIAMRSDAVFAGKCVRCGRCESHCPQHLPIQQLIREADGALRPLPYKAGIGVARMFFGRKRTKGKEQNE